ncbi:DUF3347 domain-containing protein [Sphingobacterium sp. E70]|nr:DUF3347 domain-containing protein [Sphingobacterium sp. E70]ULT27156.1 DUF3347 domain-containing protein [Sphingobacterium sp. E70]
MKRIILIVVAAMTLAACNNSKPNHTHAAHTAKEDEETSAATDKTKADTAGVADTTAKALATETAANTKTDAAVAKDRSFEEVYSAYFELKDALARDNGQNAQQAAKKMQVVVAKLMPPSWRPLPLLLGNSINGNWPLIQNISPGLMKMDINVSTL